MNVNECRGAKEKRRARVFVCVILTIVMILLQDCHERVMENAPTAKDFFLFVLFRKLESPIINDINRYTMRMCSFTLHD